ncbi:Hsp20/alpha crystallin family protein [Aeribacillus pallidus]|uniref:Hsp20/alpha crystallin family protein n=1 Tax=Aeribacillus pallidus TaxID=33936 RepID=UPI003D2210FD
MALTPYEHPFTRFQRDLERFFNSSFPQLFSWTPERFGTPRMDVHETDLEVIVHCEIPGLERKEDVTIDVDHNVLSISGKIERHYDVKEEQTHHQERYFGKFHRSLTLPADIDESSIKATYRNGILEIRATKKNPPQRRRIDVEFH